MEPMSPLEELLGSEVRARILVHFVIFPESRLSIRALGRRLGVSGKRSLQMEVDRLVGFGLLERVRSGPATLVVRSDQDASWGAFASLVQRYAPALVLRDVLMDVPGLQVAFIFGSFAGGDARADSDIDLLLYGDQIPRGAIGKAMLDAALVIDREVDAKVYDSATFRRDMQPGASFLPSALQGPKHWLLGTPDRLPCVNPLAA
jgi:predicted nucleotidyltransferase